MAPWERNRLCSRSRFPTMPCCTRNARGMRQQRERADTFPAGPMSTSNGFLCLKRGGHSPLCWNLRQFIKNAQVFVNDALVAEQRYGYTNFFVVLDPQLKYGEENEIKSDCGQLVGTQFPLVFRQRNLSQRKPRSWGIRVISARMDCSSPPPETMRPM